MDGVIEKSQLDEIMEKNRQKVKDAQAFALASPLPDAEEYLEDVYA